MLRFIETVNLINKDNGPRAVLARSLRIRHNLLDLFDPGKHSGEFDEFRLCHLRNDLR